MVRQFLSRDALIAGDEPIAYPLRILAAFFVHGGVALAAMLEEKLGELANATTRHRIFWKPDSSWATV